MKDRLDYTRENAGFAAEKNERNGADQGWQDQW